MKLIARILALALGVFAIAFAVANREPIAVSLPTLPIPIEAPLYLVALAAVAVGVVLGGTGAWLSAAPHRRRAREKRRRIADLEDELQSPRRRRPSSEPARGTEIAPTA